MFALLIPPRPVLTPPSMQTISATQFAYTFPAAPAFSHLGVFLLPEAVAIPPDFLAAIYLRFPNSPEFKLLGALGDGKQSAVFKVNAGAAGKRDLAGPAGPGAPDEVDMDRPEDDAGGTTGGGGGGGMAGDVTVGISIEAAATLAPQLAALAQPSAQPLLQGASAGEGQGPGVLTLYKPPSVPSTKVLAQRIIRNAFNFLASFSGGDGMVPLKSFEAWWGKFERKVELDPGFLEKDDGEI